jgi:hypothetical protein
MKKTKKKKKPKRRGESVYLFIWKQFVTLEQSTIFESVSQYFGFSMDLGDFFSLLSIISTNWLFFQSYGAFVDASCITDVS